MADDIVNELREWGGDGDGGEYDIEDAVPCSMLREAANLIEAQQAEIERLRSEVERLISFARLIADAEPYKTLQFDPDDVLWDRVHPTVREAADARAAVAAYEAARKEADRD